MINSSEMVNIIDKLIEKKIGKDTFRLAEVTALSTNGVRVKFDGETTESTKYYPIVGGAAILKVGDRVLMVRVKGSYAIIGRVTSGAASMYSGFAKVYAGDANGDGVTFGMGGLTVIGGGESAINLIEELGNYGNEQLHLASDNNVYIETDLQDGVAQRKTWTFNEDGIMYRPRYKEGNGYNTLSQRVNVNHQDPMVIQAFVGSVDIGTGLQAYADFSYPIILDTTPEWIAVVGKDSNSTNANFGAYNITSSGCRIYATRIRDNSTVAMAPNFQVIVCGKKV